MELGPGYTLTEIGFLPADWEVVRLSTLLDFRNGVNAAKEAYGIGTRFINVLEVINHPHIFAADVPGRVLLPPATVEAFAVRRGDVVFNRTSETQEDVGLAAVYCDDEPVVFGGFVIRGRPTRALDAKFAGYAFRAKVLRSQIAARGQGAIRANVGQADLGQVLAPLPSLREQRAIAEALGDVDESLRRLADFIAKKRALKRAAMQQLLTGATRLPGFREQWKAVIIDEVAEVRTGPFGSSLHESDYVQDGTPIITVEHLGESGIIHRGLPLVSDTDRKRLAAYSLDVGDVVFSRVGSVDRNALVRDAEAGWLFSGRLLRVRPRPKLALGQYLSHQFHGEPFKQRVREVAVGQTMASLNTRILGGVSIVLPSPREQGAIAAVLTDMDAEIAALEQRLAKTRALKQGMMQELLTGRTRLVPAASK